MADNDNGNGAFVFGFIVGAIAGAAAALFMTPRSGDEMRQEIGGRFYGATGPVLDQVGNRVQEMSGKLAAMDIPVGGERETGSIEPIPAPPPATPSIRVSPEPVRDTQPRRLAE